MAKYICDRCSHESKTRREAEEHVQVHAAAIRKGIKVEYQVVKDKSESTPHLNAIEEKIDKLRKEMKNAGSEEKRALEAR